MQPAAAFGVAPTCAEPCEPSADTKVIELDDIPDTQIDPLELGRIALRHPSSSRRRPRRAAGWGALAVTA